MNWLLVQRVTCIRPTDPMGRSPGTSILKTTGWTDGLMDFFKLVIYYCHKWCKVSASSHQHTVHNVQNVQLDPLIHLWKDFALMQ